MTEYEHECDECGEVITDTDYRLFRRKKVNHYLNRC
jgi:hypothetical protein